MYRPLLVDLAGWPILIVGGGRLALARLRFFLGGVAPLGKEAIPPKITILAPEIRPELAEMVEAEDAVTWIQDVYGPQWLAGQRIVVAATGDGKTNQAVSADCRRLGILFSQVDAVDAPLLFPALAQEEGLGRFATSYGRSPKLVKRWRQEEKKAKWQAYRQERVDALGIFRQAALALAKRSAQGKAQGEDRASQGWPWPLEGQGSLSDLFEASLDWPLEKIQGETKRLQEAGARFLEGAAFRQRSVEGVEAVGKMPDQKQKGRERAKMLEEEKWTRAQAAMDEWLSSRPAGRKLVLGSRGSKLALIQTKEVQDQLQEAFPELEIEIQIQETAGDRDRKSSLSALGGKGVFVKDIEARLLEGTIDLAVHSMKDMAATLPEGLELSYVPLREDPRDRLVLHPEKYAKIDVEEASDPLSLLAPGAKVGTGSLRRAYALRALRPDLVICPLRGNVETRIQKLQTENLDAILLAEAGLRRLGLDPKPSVLLPPSLVCPAPTQGILGLEIRSSDQKLREALSVLEVEESALAARIERAFLRATGGDCHLPVGAFASMSGESIHLLGFLGKKEGDLVQATGQAQATGQDQALPMVWSQGEQALHLAQESQEGQRKRLEAWGKAMGEDLVKKLSKKTDEAEMGMVYLVGAGPGDPGLLTLRGKEALEAADLVLVDRLVDPALLRYVPGHAEVIDVGKEPAFHKVPQEEITARMLAEAKAGKTVVRLKGGDPYLFGRGGEEGEALSAAGIPFAVVPGVSSAIGGLAYAGIPATFRQEATSLHIITAHHAQDQDLDYESLAMLQGTLVFLMGYSRLADLMEGLEKAGKAQDTPAAVITEATTARQRVVTGTIHTIAGLAQEAHFQAPALIVVGEVVRHQEALFFVEKQPLFGRTFVLFRDEKAGEKTAKTLRAKGAKVLLWPLLQLVPRPIQEGPIAQILQDLSSYDWLFFSSANGVRFFFDALKEVADLRRLGTIKIAALGPKTAQALEERGIHPDFVSPVAEGVAAAQALVQAVGAGPRDASEGKAQVGPAGADKARLLFPRAAQGREVIVETLKEAFSVEVLPLYDSLPVETEAPAIPEGSFLLFTSSAMVRAFFSRPGAGELAKKNKIISIGPITSQALREAGLPVHAQAEEYSIPGMLDRIEKDF